MLRTEFISSMKNCNLKKNYVMCHISFFTLFYGVYRSLVALLLLGVTTYFFLSCMTCPLESIAKNTFALTFKRLKQKYVTLKFAQNSSEFEIKDVEMKSYLIFYMFGMLTTIKKLLINK